MQHVSVRERAPDAFFEEFPELPRVIAQLLYNRGLKTQAAIDGFLHVEYSDLHDPFLFRHMRAACDRIFKAQKDRETIAIHGDYDADGVSGSAILKTVLDTLGISSFVYIPHRERDGYGMNESSVNYIHDHGATVIITCDCGISNAKEIAFARSLGIDTIVTDHHTAPSVLPDAVALIHPGLTDEHYPFKYLAGGGVAFKFAQALVRDERSGLSVDAIERSDKWLLDMVAISSVADMVSLVGENRILVTYGLTVLRKARRIGLKALMSEARIDEARVTAETIGYQIAPRINAAGRMDHASAAYMLLMSRDTADAQRLAQLINAQNTERQRVTERMYTEALAIAQQSDDSVRIVYVPEWSVSLAGLVAGKIVHALHVPAFVLCRNDAGLIVGSGRSIEGVNLMTGVTSCADLLTSYGGHPQACGMRFSPDVFAEVKQRLTSYFNAVVTDELKEPHIHVDYELPLAEITWELIGSVLTFAPFGQGNREPLFLTKGVTITEAKSVGKTNAHLKLVVEHEQTRLSAIAFGKGEKFHTGDVVDIVYRLTVNEWRGMRRQELIIEHMLHHETT